jgi:hypothetical protein
VPAHEERYEYSLQHRVLPHDHSLQLIERLLQREANIAHVVPVH